MTDLPSLEKRIEGATGPSMELDGLIAQAMNEMEPDFKWGTKDSWGDLLPHWVRRYEGSYEFHDPEPYTASIDAALALVERKLPGRSAFMAFCPKDTDGHASCDISNGTADPDTATAETLPLAILLALVRALNTQQTR